MKRASFLVLALVLACGPAGKKGGGPGSGGKEAAAAKAYPVTRRVPADVSWFIAAQRLDRGVGAVRDMFRALSSMERSIDPARVDEKLRRDMGFSPLAAQDLADAGFAVDKNVAAWGKPWPTLLVPVASPERVNALLDELTHGDKVVVSEVHGATLHVEHDHDVFFAWVMLDDALLVHVGPEGEDAGAWLEEILSSGPKLSHEADLDWAREHAHGDEALGLVRWPAFAGSIRTFDRADSRSPSCDAKNAAIAASLGRVAIGAALADGKVQGEAYAELSPIAGAALVGHVAPAPDAAYTSLRATAGFSLDVGVDLDWVGETLGPIADRDCGALPDLLHELELHDLADPLSRELGGPTLSSYHVALLGGSVGLGGVDVQGAGTFAVADEGRVRSLLGELGGSKKIQVNGVTGEAIDVPGAAQPVRFTLGGGVLRAGMGAGVLEKLVPGGPPAGPSELAGFAIVPDKLKDMMGALSAFGGDDLSRLVTFLEGFRTVGARADLQDRALVLQGGFELR
jgi:hypothetical protein